jgi:hypothetical protein
VAPDGTGDFTAIQPALDAAAEGQEIVVADGVYTGPGNRDLDFLGKAVVLRSENGPESCIIDCQGSEEEPHRGFYFHSGEGEDSVLEGFTITNGYVAGSRWPDSSGGAILCQEPPGSPTIRSNRIARNYAYYGGGISCFGSPAITHNVISDNRAETGGGINCYEWGTIEHNTITRNEARVGGGICCWEDFAPEIVNNIISENFAEEEGGGISVSDDAVFLLGNLIVGNATDGRGGGLLLKTAPTVNAYNTVVMNRASVDGGISGSSNFINCIVWGNTPAGSMADATYSCIDGWAEDASNIAASPRFVDPAHGDWRLRWDSPCIGAGNDAVLSRPVVDLAGNERPCGESVDIGAYEYCGDPPPDTTLFRRGDANVDGNTDLSDAVFILNYLFTGGPAPSCEKSADVDDDGVVEVTDAVRSLTHLFLGGAPPGRPFPDCGADPTPDDLTCVAFAGCPAPQ